MLLNVWLILTISLIRGQLLQKIDLERIDVLYEDSPERNDLESN